MDRERPGFEKVIKEMEETMEKSQEGHEPVEMAQEAKPEDEVKKRIELQKNAVQTAGELLKAWKARKSLGQEGVLNEAQTLMNEMRSMGEALGLKGEADEALIEAVREVAGAEDAAEIEAVLRQTGYKGGEKLAI